MRLDFSEQLKMLGPDDGAWSPKLVDLKWFLKYNKY